MLLISSMKVKIGLGEVSAKPSKLESADEMFVDALFHGED